jgi:xanthine dehydrogenase accessory factor
MQELRDTLAAWQAEGVGIGRAVVIRTFGSAPRPEGASLLVTDDGRIAGSVSGGCVEGAAAEEIARARSTGRSRVVRYGISDEEAWDVGLACGGTIDVLIEPEVAPEVAAAASHPGRAVITPLPADSPPPEFGQVAPGDGAPPEPKTVVAAREDSSGVPVPLTEAAHEALLRGTSKTVALAGRQYFVEAFPKKPRLIVVGAVEAARTLVAIARDLGYETIVVDGREAFATKERFPDGSVDQLIVGWPDEVAEQIGMGPDDAVAILSHDVKFDEPAIVEALRRGARYVGAVGSRKTQSDRRARLRAAGVSDGDLARLHGPIGLDLGGRQPAEMALAIMAEIVAARYGATGQPMRDRTATVHIVPEPAPIAGG